MRNWAIILTAGCLAACAPGQHADLWPGSGWQKASVVPAPAAPATTPNAPPAPPGAAAVAAPTPPPAVQDRRRGSSTPPDVIFRDRQREDYQTTPPREMRPAPVIPQSNADEVVRPRDSNNPYSADGYGYQRSGTSIQGPRGEMYNQVGPTLFGPNGSTCNAVGGTVFCN